MAATGSDRGRRRPGALSAWLSVLFGLLAVAALPAAIGYSRFSEEFELLHAGWAIPVAAVFGLVALGLARRARRRLRVTLHGRRGVVRTGRLLGALALALALAAAISVAFYRVLVEFQ